MITPEGLLIFAITIIALLAGAGIWLARRKGLNIGGPRLPPKPKPRPLVPMPPEGWQPPPPPPPKQIVREGMTPPEPRIGQEIRDLEYDRSGALPITIENFKAIVRHVLREEGLIK